MKAKHFCVWNGARHIFLFIVLARHSKDIFRFMELKVCVSLWDKKRVKYFILRWMTFIKKGKPILVVKVIKCPFNNFVFGEVCEERKINFTHFMMENNRIKIFIVNKLNFNGIFMSLYSQASLNSSSNISKINIPLLLFLVVLIFKSRLEISIRIIGESWTIKKALNNLCNHNYCNLLTWYKFYP